MENYYVERYRKEMDKYINEVKDLLEFKDIIITNDEKEVIDKIKKTLSGMSLSLGGLLYDINYELEHKEDGWEQARKHRMCFDKLLEMYKYEVSDRISFAVDCKIVEEKAHDKEYYCKEMTCEPEEDNCRELKKADD